MSTIVVADCYSTLGALMGTTSPVRVDDELFASAKAVGAVMSRSAAQQIAHWARIGRELEAGGSISLKEISLVLAGSADYDKLNVYEQAVVRTEWEERIAAR
jgi:hypothetical protein